MVLNAGMHKSRIAYIVPIPRTVTVAGGSDKNRTAARADRVIERCVCTIVDAATLITVAAEAHGHDIGAPCDCRANSPIDLIAHAVVFEQDGITDQPAGTR